MGDCGRMKTGGVRMQRLLESGILPLKGGVCIDLYNQAVWDDVFVTITTRVDLCSHYWVTVEE